MVLPIARIVVIDSNSERRETTRVGLTALGVGSITEFASISELDGLNGYDVLVIQADDAKTFREIPSRFAEAIPPCWWWTVRPSV